MAYSGITGGRSKNGLETGCNARMIRGYVLLARNLDTWQDFVKKRNALDVVKKGILQRFVIIRL